MIKIAFIQMTSSNNLSNNLYLMERFLDKACSKGAQLVAFPELAYFMGNKKEWTPLLQKYSELSETFASWAKEYSVFLIPGSLREPAHRKKDKYYNTLLAFNPKGQNVAKYRKIFLFKANLTGDKSYDETADCCPGKTLSTFSCHKMKVGLAICFDLRFPELFRGLKKRGAQIVILPTSFTVPTGKAHWDVLTRARAIENQLFFITPSQVGVIGRGTHTYGHSRAISPWGEVIAELTNKQGTAYCEVSPETIKTIQKKLNAWSSRRQKLFPIA